MIVYGKQIILYLASKQPQRINEIYLSKKLSKDEFAKLAKTGKKIIQIDNQKAQSLSRGGNHQGYLAHIIPPEPANLGQIIKSAEKLVIAHEITDVGNIGSIARTAYAMGFSALIVSGCDFGVSGALRSSAAALFELPFCTCKDALSLINELKMQNFTVYATANQSDALSHTKAFGAAKEAVVLGSEGKGLSARMIKACSACVKIELSNDFDSLNVSNAFAIIADRMKNGL